MNLQDKDQPLQQSINLETGDIQGIIISGFKYLPFSRYLFLQIDNPVQARTWLKKICPAITTAKIEQTRARRDPAINIAFTHVGLKQLGLSNEALNTFPQEFIEGMAAPYRSRQLGDVEKSKPEEWEKPWHREWTKTLNPEDYQVAEQRIHILLIIQAADHYQLEKCCEVYLKQFDDSKKSDLSQAGRIIYKQDGYQYKPSECGQNKPDRYFKEHFGFRDSISQPAIEGSGKLLAPGQDCIKAGEFILGYPNALSTNTKIHLPPTPIVKTDFNHLKVLRGSLRDFGCNGSYLVFRKLRQDVELFHKYFDLFEKEEKELMKAKLVGRWPSGVPLSLSPDRDPLADANGDAKLIEEWEAKLNDFSYRDKDASGYGCPLGAHIRRVNPRDSLGDEPEESIKTSKLHRIIRRGALYEDTEGREKGLLFICINANIRRQFEFIQQSWVQSSNFNGLYGEIDPLIGKDPKEARREMTLQQEPIRQSLQNLPTFVTVRAGGYFFLPSISALHFLAELV
jgi:Dyp-type peroxidase family